MVKVKIIRHTFKGKGKSTAFTPVQVAMLRGQGRQINTLTSVKGRRAAFQEGRQHGFDTTGKFLMPGTVDSKTKFYAGRRTDNSIRTTTTADAVRMGVKKVGGQVYPKTRYARGLAFEDNQTLNLPKLYEVFEKKFANNEPRALRAYLDGSTLDGTMVPAKTVVKLLVRRLAVGVRYELMREHNIQQLRKTGASDAQITEFLKTHNANMLNFTHSWATDAVVEALTGKRIESFSPPGMTRELEGIHFDVTPKKITLKYRGETFDVTKTLMDKYPSVFRGVFDWEKIQANANRKKKKTKQNPSLRAEMETRSRTSLDQPANPPSKAFVK